MEESTNTKDSLLGFIEELVETIINDPEQINTFLVSAVTYVAIGIWITFGLKLFLDYKRRFESNIIILIVVFILSILTGIVGFIIYSILRPKYTLEELEFFQIEHKFYHEQASKVLECIRCGNYVFSSSKHCTHCGFQNRYSCPNCGHYNSLKDSFCGSCGHDLFPQNKEILDSFNSNKKLETLNVLSEQEYKKETKKREDSKSEKSIEEGEVKFTEKSNHYGYDESTLNLEDYDFASSELQDENETTKKEEKKDSSDHSPDDENNTDDVKPPRGTKQKNTQLTQIVQNIKTNLNILSTNIQRFIVNLQKKIISLQDSKNKKKKKTNTDSSLEEDEILNIYNDLDEIDDSNVKKENKTKKSLKLEETKVKSNNNKRKQNEADKPSTEETNETDNIRTGEDNTNEEVDSATDTERKQPANEEDSNSGEGTPHKQSS